MAQLKFPSRQLPVYKLCLGLIVAGTVSRTSADFLSAQYGSPVPCESSGWNSTAWTHYHNLQVFQVFKQTILFDICLNNAVNDSQTHITFRACTPQNSVLIQGPSQYNLSTKIEKMQTQTAVEPSSGKTNQGIDENSVNSAIIGLINYLKLNPAQSTMLAFRDNVVAGFFVGPGINPESAVTAMDTIANNPSAQTTQRAIQWCGDAGGTNDTQSSGSFGLILDTQGDISAVQSVLAKWAAGECLHGDQSNSTWWSNVSVSMSGSTGSSNITHGQLNRRSTCSYIQAQAGDGCFSLAQRCGITQDQFESYNGGSSICSTVQVNQYVCCSSGSPPDFSPQPTNGNCYPYTVQAGDTCGPIATAHQMQVSGIVNNNNLTWGWMGCSDLQIGQNICLSTGNPPFPANVANAVCGPQVNNTTPTTDPTTWASLNPCQLNACCDIWGQCGITSDFCTAGTADTGAPGTAQPGSSGCISNCGTQIVTSGAPDSFARIGYFEAWNNQRPCLNMWPQSIPPYYTHVHFAFANISNDYNVDISTVQDMFNQFRAATGFKHILSFGGWAFSTDVQTYPIFRQGVTAAERQTFATNVANFIMENNMDGVDFDWEYPGAPDIPGIPPGSPEDGANYLSFLQMMRTALPPQYSISIAAPASYWYLRGFPIANISNVVDYIIYMTYDLHGQWDYGNNFTDPGCPLGNCLRSHVNRTETEEAFSMITKAGVPSYKIMVGLALYGRSFEMTTPGCYTEMCTYTGPNSTATPGKCTGTPGYISNWEIDQILETPGNNAQQYYSNVAGDIVIYNNTQWVSYMTTQTYNSRLLWAQSLNFGGTSDWAMDLETSYYGNGTEIGTGSGDVYIDPSALTVPDPTVACQPPCNFIPPPWTLSTATVITPDPITETILEMYQSTETLSNGITSTVYVSVTTVTVITLPPLTTDTISVFNVEWTDVDETIIYFTTSIIFPPLILTESPDVVTTGTKSTTIPGIIYTYSPGVYTGPGLPNPTTGPPPGPPPGHTGSVHVTKGDPKSTCGAGILGCGSKCKILCHISVPCIGICGCVGIGCPNGGGCLGDGCGAAGNGGNEGETSCSVTHTVSDCQVDCSITDYGSSTTTTCYSTSCVTVEACTQTGWTTTSATTTFNCPWTTALQAAMWRPNDPNGPVPMLGAGSDFGYTYITGPNPPVPGPVTTAIADCQFFGQDPDNGVGAQYCVCGGQTYPATTNTAVPGNMCAYTALPGQTTSISTVEEVVTSNCQVCTFMGDNAQCNMLPGCTPTPTATATVTPPAPSADCIVWTVDDLYFTYVVYNIVNWATDGGQSLHKQEKGCGALTGWKWQGATPQHYPAVTFNLPLIMAPGCPERAVRSAGGPQLVCMDQGINAPLDPFSVIGPKKRNLELPGETAATKTQ